MKKFITFLVFLLICAAAVFFFGWIQFAVPVDKFGVMASKTGGVYSTVIMRGQFSWRYERLIPTNTKIALFSGLPFIATETIEGELPSAKMYAEWLSLAPVEASRTISAAETLNVHPDVFSYSAVITGAVRIKPESLPALYERGAVIDQDSLDAFLKQKRTQVSRLACDALLEQKKVDDAFAAQISALPEFAEIEILSLDVEKSTIPDIELYNRARASYNVYRNQVDAALLRLAGEHAQSLMKSGARMDQLEKFNELLQKNPSLLELLSKTDSPAVVIQALNALLGM